AQRPSADLAEGVTLEAHGGRIVAQARAVAGRARHIAHQVIQLLPIGDADARGLIQSWKETLVLETWSGSEARTPLTPTPLPSGERGQGNPVFVGAIENGCLRIGVKLLEGRIEGEADMPRQRFRELQEWVAAIERRPGGDRAVAQRQPRIAHQ